MGLLYRSKHEMVFVYRVPGAAHTNAVELGRHGRNRTNVWDYISTTTPLSILSKARLLEPLPAVQANRRAV